MSATGEPEPEESRQDLSAAELIRRYEAGTRDFRGSHLDRYSDFALDRHADLRGANLEGIVLSDSLCECSDLSQSNLRRADLRRTGLWMCNLKGADLSGSDLSDSWAKGSHLQDANLRAAEMSSVEFTPDCRLSGANLSGANLRKANLKGATLMGADLAGSDLTGANLSATYLAEAYLSRANLRKANLTRANLTGADLIGADLASANLTDANLTGANLSGANLRKANLKGANLAGADLTGTDLTAAWVTHGQRAAAKSSKRATLPCGLSAAELLPRFLVATLPTSLVAGAVALMLFGLLPGADCGRCTLPVILVMTEAGLQAIVTVILRRGRVPPEELGGFIAPAGMAVAGCLVLYVILYDSILLAESSAKVVMDLVVFVGWAVVHIILCYADVWPGAGDLRENEYLSA